MIAKLLRRFGASGEGHADKAELTGFDAAFYYRYYSDLRHLERPKALARHFLEHGFKEGRFKNLDQAVRHYRATFGDLPADFSAKLYKALNEDLAARFDHDWQYEFHYMEYGRREGRPYKIDDQPGPGRRRPWARLFRLPDFIACAHSWLVEPPASKEAAMELFEAVGIDRLAPINLDYRFDPAFYRTTYDFDDELPDAALYRHWLESGAERSWYPNEEKALQHLVADRCFPAAFDWVGYKAGLPDREARRLRNRVEVLQHYFDHGFEKRPDRYVGGPEAGAFYVAVADYHLIRGHHAVAISAYDQAVATGQAGVGAIHRRGDAFAASGKIVAAHADFARAASSEAAGVWSHVHAARTAAELHSFERAFDLLARARPAWSRNAEYRKAVAGIIERCFDSKAQSVRSLYEAGDRAVADPYMLASLDEIVRRILQLEDMPPAGTPAKDGHVAILANLDLPQCRHYRIDQKVSQLARAGLEAVVVDQKDTAAFSAALVGARAAIFYRVPAFPGIVRAILTARALGLPTYYEIDDLVFDPAHYPDPLESFEGQISLEEYNGLLFGVPLFRYAMSLCDRGIASTTPLAREVEKLVRSHECLVLRNALDERNAEAIAMGRQPRSARETVTIFYGSGTKAHNADVNELVGPALLRVMAKDPRTRLVVVGHLRLRPELERFRDRITRLDLITDIDDYWAVLAASDINLAVLARSLATDCKSEIKWLEAAVLQVPSIVSATATYREVLEDGVDALLVEESPEAWAEALLRLVGDPDLRCRIGAAARQKALSRYGLDIAAELLREEFGPPPTPRGLAPGKPREMLASPRTGKPKVLVCHVFFAPQGHGGATRVVQDNVDYLLDQCPDIDVAVLTTDDGVSPPGRLRLDQYKGIPVYRISTPIEANMDWRPFDPANVDLVERILDKERPDLVHFHCIQRLTGSVVEAVRARGIPYLVTVHDGWWISDHQFLVDSDDILRLPSTDAFDAVPPPGISLAASIMRRQRLASLLDGAEHVLSVSESFAEIYRRAGVRDVLTIENGVSALVPAKRKRRPDGRLVLGHVGGRSAHKGAKLVEAVLRTTSFDHLALTMVDASMEPGARSERMWGTTPVLLRGPCPQAEVASLYASIDVLLAPSIWPESFGLVAREAKALGLWVVASDRGAIAEGIENGRDGFVIDVSDGRSLAEVLRRLDADFERFAEPPPSDSTPMRTAADQGREIAELYRTTAKMTPLTLLSSVVGSLRKA